MQAAAARRPRIVAGLRLLRLIGDGGEGEVWEARDQRGRPRALKLIRPQSLAEPDDVARRGRHLLRIDHSSLVRVYRGGHLANGPLTGWGFLEMAYIEGDALADAPADEAVLDRLVPLAEALDLLHSGRWSDGLPLIHRDIKPANLVRRPDGSLVLVDPSTLRGLDATHLTRIGTPVFCAPEIMSGQIGPAADVYSFAVTAVALLTGARGRDLAALIDAAPALDLPEGVRRALSPHPSRRPASCESVLDATIVMAGQSEDRWGAAAAEWADPADRWRPEPGERRRHDREPRPREDPGHWDGHDRERRHRENPDHWDGDDRERRHRDDREGWDRGPAWAAEPVPRQMRRAGERTRVTPWLVLLAAIAGLAAAAAFGALPAPALLGAAALHVAAHAVARRPLALALLAPPVAWAFLLAERAAPPGRRRAWASAQLSGALLATSAAALAALLDPPALRGLPAAAVITAGAAVVAIAAVAPRLNGGAGVTVRLALAPVWAAGAAALVAGAIVCLPFAMLAGRAQPLLRMAARSVAAGLEVLRGPPLPA